LGRARQLHETLSIGATCMHLAMHLCCICARMCACMVHLCWKLSPLSLVRLSNLNICDPCHTSSSQTISCATPDPFEALRFTYLPASRRLAGKCIETYL
jgi:hypothetical protein